MYLFASAILITMFACEKKGGDIIDNDIAIRYTDSIGNDLLNPISPNAIKAADIDLYYIIDGIKKRVYDPNMDTPENFKIEYSETLKSYILVIFLNDKYDSNKFSETIIEFGNRSDTLRANWDVSENGNSIAYHNVWYNSEMKITEGPSQFVFEIRLE
jgi:hypothetical protein